MNKKQPSRIPFFTNHSMQLVLAELESMNNGELRLLQSVIEGLLNPIKITKEQREEMTQQELDFQGGES
tara:strand:- start:160 stop:366 length:207 start_codon:yes stop_codon:yes gene_type:complete